ncbi:MAG: hypothetical protein A2583_05115 [Bdellovibrionales bacterium RIFOXYD1_FULL_53_11]|nr:MAG: hypothetical protein A2583_05115 [Bdellovibrionales bacterium RIFOXYD1_FULL_53_11]
MAGIIKISEAASLALHAAYIMAETPDSPHAVSRMSKSLGVSNAHLAKVLQRLTTTGITRSIRGPTGGFVLSKNPQKVTLLDVYEAISGSLKPTECLLQKPVCGGKSCILGDLLCSVDNKVRQQLASTRLSDLHATRTTKGAGA